MRMARNHGELAGASIGLNLRMTEVTAAIALVQLKKADKIISERIEIAETLTDMVKDLPDITPPVVRDGCKHVYYCWAAKIDSDRDAFVDAMVAEGVPLRKGYVEPLYKLPAFQKFKTHCPVAEKVQSCLALYENCSYSPTTQQLKQFRIAFEKVAD